MIIYREEKMIIIKENDELRIPEKRIFPISYEDLQKDLQKGLRGIVDPENIENIENIQTMNPLEFINKKNKNIEIEHIYLGLRCLEEYVMIIYLLKYCNNFYTITDSTISGILWKEDTLEMYLPKDFTIKIQEQNGKRFLVEFITLDSEIINDAHSNVLIYDKKLNVLEIYDPNGITTQFANQCLFYDCMFEFFRRIHKGKNVSLITNTNTKGIQTKDGVHSSGSNGFCAMWTLLYTELRLSFPDYDSEILQQIMTSEIIKIGKLDYIYNFSKYFELFSRKFHVDNKYLIKMYNKKYLNKDEDLERLYYHDMITDIQKEDNQEIRRSKRNRPNL